MDLRSTWNVTPTKHPFTPEKKKKVIRDNDGGVGLADAKHIDIDVVWENLGAIAQALDEFMDLEVPRGTLEWLKRQLKNGQIVIHWIRSASHVANTFLDDSFQLGDVCWTKNSQGIHHVGRTMALVEISGLHNESIQRHARFVVNSKMLFF